MRALAVATLTSLICAPALAAAPASPTPVQPAPTVSPLVVTPHVDPAKIVSSFPAAGQAVAPGALVVRITFDQKMDERHFAFAPAAGGKMPDCLKTPRLLKDGKTFVLLCTTRRSSSYALAFNADPKVSGFANIGGSRAAPATLDFTTNASDDGPRDLSAALKVAGLTDADMPIADSP